MAVCVFFADFAAVIVMLLVVVVMMMMMIVTVRRSSGDRFFLKKLSVVDKPDNLNIRRVDRIKYPVHPDLVLSAYADEDVAVLDFSDIKRSRLIGMCFCSGAEKHRYIGGISGNSPCEIIGRKAGRNNRKLIAVLFCGWSASGKKS